MMFYSMIKYEIDTQESFCFFLNVYRYIIIISIIILLLALAWVITMGEWIRVSRWKDVQLDEFETEIFFGFFLSTGCFVIHL